MQIASLEFLVIPHDLDGHDGQYRIPRELLKIPAENDLEAVFLWLDKHKYHESTFRRYRIVADQLMNWTLIKLGKPLSSLNEYEFSKYCAFLQDPLPREDWIAPKIERSSKRWRPFNRPLSLVSVTNNIAVLRSLITFLDTSGYCRIWDLIFQITEKRSGQAFAMALRERPIKEPFSLVSWQLLSELIEQKDAPEHLQARLALQLLFYCCVKPSVLTTLTSDDFEYGDWMILSLQEGAEKRIVYVAPPVLKTIHLLMENAILSRDFGKRPNSHQRLFNCSLHTLKKEIHALLRLTAQKINDPQFAEKLLNPTLLDIKRGGMVYAARHGAEMWKLIGVASIQKTIYSACLAKRAPLSTPQIIDLYAGIGLH